MNHERCDKVATQASNEIKGCTFDAAYTTWHLMHITGESKVPLKKSKQHLIAPLLWLYKKHWRCTRQGWKLKFWSTRHLGAWPSNCTRPDQFSLAQSFCNHGQPTCHFRENFLVFVFSYPQGGSVFLSLDTFDTGRYLHILTLPVFESKFTYHATLVVDRETDCNQFL